MATGKAEVGSVPTAVSISWVLPAAAKEALAAAGMVRGAGRDAVIRSITTGVEGVVPLAEGRTTPRARATGADATGVTGATRATGALSGVLLG
jgi:hypothetical protein